MPTYDYKCDACGHEFENFQSITSAPIKKCPKCGKNKVKRLLGTGAGFVFKGSGFYITDYRSDSYQKAAKSESGESKPADAGAKTDTGTSKPAADAKPAAKSSEKPASKPDKGSGRSKK